MHEHNMELIQQMQEKKALLRLMDCNQRTAAFGLRLTEENARLLLAERKDTLRQQERLEFGGSILPDLIDAFCGSAYIEQDSYTETLITLQDIFYTYKNESLDLLTDRELLDFMAWQFEEVCFGDLHYLETTCLERFCRAIRQGKDPLQKERDEYTLSGDPNPYTDLSEETRWDRELFWKALEDSF